MEQLESSQLIDFHMEGVIIKIPFIEVTTLARQMLLKQPDLRKVLNDEGKTHIALLDSACCLIAEEKKYILEELGEWPNP